MNLRNSVAVTATAPKPSHVSIPFHWNLLRVLCVCTKLTALTFWQSRICTVCSVRVNSRHIISCVSWHTIRDVSGFSALTCICVTSMSWFWFGFSLLYPHSVSPHFQNRASYTFIRWLLFGKVAFFSPLDLPSFAFKASVYAYRLQRSWHKYVCNINETIFRYLFDIQPKKEDKERKKNLQITRNERIWTKAIKLVTIWMVKHAKNKFVRIEMNFSHCFGLLLRLRR